MARLVAGVGQEVEAVVGKIGSLVHFFVSEKVGFETLDHCDEGSAGGAYPWKASENEG